MEETISTLALLCWQIVMMGGYRAAQTSSTEGRRLALFTLASLGLVVSVAFAFKTWPATVAFFWWWTSWMVAALVVLWVGAYVREKRQHLPATLGGLTALGTWLALGAA